MPLSEVSLGTVVEIDQHLLTDLATLAAFLLKTVRVRLVIWVAMLFSRASSGFHRRGPAAR